MTSFSLTSRQIIALSRISLLAFALVSASCSDAPSGTGSTGGGVNNGVDTGGGADAGIDGVAVDSVGGQDGGDDTGAGDTATGDTATGDSGNDDTATGDTGSDTTGDDTANADDTDAGDDDANNDAVPSDVTSNDDATTGDATDDATGDDTTAKDTVDGASSDTVADSDVGDATIADTDATADAIADAIADTTTDATADAAGDPSCKDQCGSFISGATCQCDPGCSAKGDCCADWKALCGCAKNADCDDGDGCTIDTCDAGAAVCNNLAKPCDDGKPCTVDSCSAGACVAKAGNDGAICSDGDACTVSDACSGGICNGAGKKCDDGDPCTADSCSAATGACTAKPGNDGAVCDDGQACTSSDLCKAGGCKGVAKVCDDGNVCTIDGCSANTGACIAAADVDGKACDDGNSCTANDACAAGKCTGAGKDCDDGNPCTVDGCDAKTQDCTHGPAQDGAKCTDFNPCTELDACKGDVCVGSAKICDDKDACTADSCDKQTGGCVTSASKDGTPCDDGDLCTPTTTCSAGACKGTTKTCDDGKPCTKDACDVKTGACVASALLDGAPCNDGDACSTGDACNKGDCAATPKACNDGNPCTNDSCNKANGACVHSATQEGSSCEDGNACTGGEACTKGACIGGKSVCTLAKVWSDDIVCDGKGWTMLPNNAEPKSGWHVDATPVAVKPVSGACTLNFNNGTDYDDGIVVGTATSLKLKVPMADRVELRFFSYHDTETGAAYDKRYVEVSPDGFNKVAIIAQLSNGKETKKWLEESLTLDAFAGQEVQVRFRFDSVDAQFNTTAGWFIDDVSLYAGDKPGSCQGRCGAPASNGGCACDAACEKAGNCCADKAAACKAGCAADKDCNGGAICTIDSCVAGQCKSLPAKDGGVCNDGKLCTDADACKNGVCVGKALACDDGNSCTFDSCDAVAGCQHGPNSGGPCDDGKLCTKNDTCNAGTCSGGDAICDDGKPCTIDSCDAATGACTAKALDDGTLCDDGDPCTASDRCKTAVCLAGNPKCTDSNPCTLDACDAKTGACSNVKVADGKPCSDGDACTLGDVCGAGGCKGSAGCDWTTLWQHDLDCGSKDVAFAPDQAEPALAWHIDGTPEGVTPKTGKCSLNYNNGKDYVGTTGRQVGRATLTKMVTLPAKGAARLRFFSYHDTETSNSYDKRFVEISADGFKSAVEVKQLDNASGSKTWKAELVDLGGWLGKAVQVRFTIDTIDGVSNTTAGWFVDDVVFEAGSAAATSCAIAADCDDGDVCTSDACANKVCAHVGAKDGIACGDGDACISAATCQSGACKGTSKVCDDGNACTYDSCKTTTGCTSTTGAAGATCDDGDNCTNKDVCTGSSCKGVAACDDGKPCTTDACDAKTGACSATIAANGKVCDDGDGCTSGDVCTAGACKGPAKDCDDANGCTVDTCDAKTGACANVVAADGAVCQDGNPCTLAGSCKAGKCAIVDVCTYKTVLGEPFDCGKTASWTMVPDAAEPKVAWHVDGTPDTVKPHSAACSLNFNNGKDFADGSATVGGSATSALVQLPQTGHAVMRFWQYFDGETASIYDRTWVYVSSDGFQKDVKVIEIDQGTGAKTWREIKIEIDDQIGKKIAVRFTFDSVDGVANTGAGWFVDDLTIEVGAGASDKSCDGRCGLLTPGAVCQCNAKCVEVGDCCTDYKAICTGCAKGGDCDDNNGCTVDTCDAQTGECKNVLSKDSAACDDGSVCTSAEVCKSGVCGGGDAKKCDDGNPCTFDGCDAKTGCTAVAAPAPCDDGDPCTNVDGCKAGTCSGSVKSCDDGNSCTTDACNTKTGECASTAKTDGALCSDEALCTSADACKAGKCVGVAKSCDDGLACTIDACDAKTGACSHVAAKDGAACNDGDDCTVNSACASGACVGTDICDSKTLFTDTFACGTVGFWTMVPASKDPVGATPGVVGWAVDSSPEEVAPKSPACSMNFNNGVNFNNGTANKSATRVVGTASLVPALGVPVADGAEVAFWSYSDVENNDGFDQRFVEISDDNFVASVESIQLTNGGQQKIWKLETIDLKNWMGHNVRLRFRFDSIDAQINGGAGWFVDDASLRTRSKAACKVATDCGDDDQCAKWACTATKCVATSTSKDGAACSDGDACTSADSCKAGKCAGTSKVCNDGDPCSWDACNSANGTCYAKKASDGTPCGDGKVCGAGTCKLP